MSTSPEIQNYTDQYFDFKEIFCDENKTLIEIIKNELCSFFNSPILDVGSGIGDIATNALTEKRVVLLDINKEFEEKECLPHHSRVSGDFFDFKSKEQIQTIFIAHTLQFLHHNVAKLNKKVREINPKRIIVVLNTNDDILGKLISWVEKNKIEANPERGIPNFPTGYTLQKSIPFQAKVQCSDFNSLAIQISYLFLMELGEKHEKLMRYLKDTLPSPEFIFNQSINIYQKDE